MAKLHFGPICVDLNATSLELRIILDESFLCPIAVVLNPKSEFGTKSKKL